MSLFNCFPRFLDSSVTSPSFTTYTNTCTNKHTHTTHYQWWSYGRQSVCVAVPLLSELLYTLTDVIVLHPQLHLRADPVIADLPTSLPSQLSSLSHTSFCKSTSMALSFKFFSKSRRFPFRARSPARRMLRSSLSFTSWLSFISLNCRGDDPSCLRSLRRE